MRIELEARSVSAKRRNLQENDYRLRHRPRWTHENELKRLRDNVARCQARLEWIESYEPTSARERLVKLCGMFGSNSQGERANAAAEADKLVRGKGRTWEDAISLEI